MQQSLQPGEDATQIVADSGEDDVCSVTLTAFEMATTEVTFGLHVADHGLDCRATSEFALDGAEDAALLTEDEDATRVSVNLAAITRASAYD